jgi:hypothetical protein
VIGAAIDCTILQLLGHDLPDARAAHPFLGRDFVISETLAQPREDAPPPEDHAVSAQPPAPDRRLLFNHPTLLPRPDPTGKTTQSSIDSENHKENVAAMSFCPSEI